MRSLPILIAGALAASCTVAPPPPNALVQPDPQLHQLLAGKVAQAPVNCLPLRSGNDMRVINENTLAFRDGPSRVFLAHTTGCSSLQPNGPYALVTKQYGGNLCRGDFAQVRDLHAGVPVGSCVIEGFTPYIRAGR